MESKRCMNNSCATSSSIQWHKGWTLRSGASALLCDYCGSAYEQSQFCDVFHLDEDGWRQCCLCGKDIHCGCIASRPFIVLQDYGGIFCINCSNNSGQVPELTSSEMPTGDIQPSNDCIVGLSSKRSEWLPCCWPQLTDQDRTQTNGVPNSIIVSLFEKKLSPSDVGRLRRVIIPKKFAEEYFPPISHAEGINIPMHDEVGQKWMFRFRYWENNHSRMYVLEAVSLWLYSKQLQAGDTVTFSRMDPERKYIIGFRKKPISSAQDASKQEITLNEAQQLLCPSVKPNIVVIDGLEIEEYDQPPIFGKKSN